MIVCLSGLEKTFKLDAVSILMIVCLSGLEKTFKLDAVSILMIVCLSGLEKTFKLDAVAAGALTACHDDNLCWTLFGIFDELDVISR